MKQPISLLILIICSSCLDVSLNSDKNTDPDSQSSSQDCSLVSVGSSCGGGIYAGEFNGRSLITTPGNCNEGSPVTCDGTIDTLKKRYNNLVNWGDFVDLDDGETNSQSIFALSSNPAEAVAYCMNLSYGGFDDWYLPARNELNLLYTNRAAIGGFASPYPSIYWSSSYPAMGLAGIDFSDGSVVWPGHWTATDYVRCVRKD